MVAIAFHFRHVEGCGSAFPQPVPVALLPVLTSFAVRAAAWCDGYPWTDAKGKTFCSDVLPKSGEKVKDFEVVAKEARPAAKVPAYAATPTEQALLERIARLDPQH
jgi:hypothetical protein